MMDGWMDLAVRSIFSPWCVYLLSSVCIRLYLLSLVCVTSLLGVCNTLFFLFLVLRFFSFPGAYDATTCCIGLLCTHLYRRALVHTLHQKQ
ncbi:hypothetical protein C8R45DRAFT_989276 [Mycena sanguinolenta]|nr:hypothetical protein C8R45DRAFT_989276 [Mycena sanguinolenta]